MIQFFYDFLYSDFSYLEQVIMDLVAFGFARNDGQGRKSDPVLLQFLPTTQLSLFTTVV